MNADIYFQNAEFYAAPSGQRLRVRLGEEFIIGLNSPTATIWGSTKDAVLRIVESADNLQAAVTATASGTCKILLLTDALAVNFHINVEVFNPAEAVALNPTAGIPEPR